MAADPALLPEGVSASLAHRLPTVEVVHSEGTFVFTSLVPGGSRQGQSFNSLQDATKTAALALAAIKEFDRMASLSPQTFVPRSIEVEAQQVLAETIEQVAQWSGGQVGTWRDEYGQDERVIWFDGYFAQPGTWVIKTPGGIEVASAEAFEQYYRKAG